MRETAAADLVSLRVDVRQGSDPICGSITREGDSESFSGWLALNEAIERARQGPAPASGPVAIEEEE